MPRIEKLNSFHLEPMSDATRQILCDFAVGDSKRSLRQIDVDWEEVFQGVCRHGLIGLTHTYLKLHEPQGYPPVAFRRWVQQAFAVDSLRMAVLYRHIRGVLLRLNDAGVDHMVVKGPAVARILYRHVSLRSFGDLDVVVRERDWAQARRVLIDMGFAPVEDLPHPPPKVTPPVVLHGTHFWDKDAQFLVEVHYDDLLETGLASRDVEGFWKRATVADVQGVPTKVLSLEDQLLHLSAHVHYHGYTRLNWLSDIACIVRDHAERLDWDRVVETVRVEEAQVPVYYTLHFLERLLGVSVPAGVLARLRPDRFRRWLHERYLPEEQVLSLQPMAHPSFAFYFLPLFRRLLPDLLVMGRRIEKLQYLLRLLFPPRAWLRYYYQLRQDENVAPHYVLHPLKLAHYYLTEIVIAVSRLLPWRQRLDDAGPWWSVIVPERSATESSGMLMRLGSVFRLSRAAQVPGV